MGLLTGFFSDNVFLDSLCFIIQLLGDIQKWHFCPPAPLPIIFHYLLLPSPPCHRLKRNKTFFQKATYKMRYGT